MIGQNTIDLRLKKSHTHTIKTFPDGQQQLTLSSDVHFSEKVYILSNFKNFLDVENIISAQKILKHMGVNKTHLFVPYFLGARSDRRFSYFESHYLKDVICPVINSLGFERVYVLDPHSDVLEGILDNIYIIKPSVFLKYVYNKLDNPILISPDANYHKKIPQLLNDIKYKKDLIQCTKIKNINENKIEKIIVPDVKKYDNFLIVDDIVDTGDTATLIAREIKKQNENSKINLACCHGIFSKGLDIFDGLFENIYTTNSYYDKDSCDFINVYNIFKIIDL